MMQTQAIPKAVLQEYLKILRAERMYSLKEKEYKAKNKIEFFVPIGSRPGEMPYQTGVIDYLFAGKKIVCLVGGNAIGKTHLGAHLVGAACLGIQPWDGRDPVWVWGGSKTFRPVKVRIICSDWDKHAATVMVPKLKDILPADQYSTTKNNVGVEAFFKFKNGSTIQLITDKQDTSDHEGWEGDMVWADEPFGRDKFIANLRGLRRVKEDLNSEDPGMGIFLITMTAVRESWMLDDIVLNTNPNYASITEIPMTANPYLSKEYQITFEASLREDEKIARIKGGWLNLAGLVWKGFRPDLHIIEDFDIPTDWPVVCMIDFHPGTPHAISFYTVDPQQRYYVIREDFTHATAEELADLIIRAKQQNTWRIEEAYIDPLSKGDTAYMKNRNGDAPDAFTVIKERIGRYGIDLHVGSKDQSSGIVNVEGLLMGPNKMPTLFFFKNACSKIKQEGHIWEIQRWNYDEDQKPKPNFHFMENLYRFSLVGLKYRPMRDRKRSEYAETDFNVFAPNFGLKDDDSN